MSESGWKLQWEIFEAAVDLGPDDQKAYLDNACASDAELRKRVENLIAKDAHDTGLLDRAIDEAEFMADATANRPQHIGPYRIVQELGRGGMGQVYLGQREDPDFKQQVAIKLIPLGRYSEHVQKRFIVERQILSDLDHENIARLLDGGVTDEGIPYLIMEYIDGLTIDEYCSSHQLDLTARLLLFQQVCQAVHYAHKQLIVHRDIKPGNVLVDTSGRIKLLDFGIAKLLEPGLTADPAVTETVGRMITPEYASPEQLNGERLSTATDIYSLGVLLYQLLTGRRPIQIERGDIQSTVRAITREKPIRPSQIEQESGASRQDLHAPPSKLLKGDLDNIVMKALRKNPERRYGSAAQFAQDIHRHLEGFPVYARPESVKYRAGKFVQRHPVGVIVSTLISVVLVALTVTSFLQARNLQVALADANLAQTKATQVAEFLRDLFQANDPLGADQGSRSTQALLADGASRIRTDLADQPELQASLMKTMADVYLNMSMHSEAYPLAKDALAIYESIGRGGDPEKLEAMLSLSRILYMQEEAEESLSICRSVIETVEANAHPDPLLKAKAQAQCAASLTLLGHYQESIELAQSSLSTRLKHLSGEHELVAQARRTLGINYWFRAEYEVAREQFELAHGVLVRRYGAGHPRAIALLDEIASVELRSGDLERAEAIYREALSQRMATLGRDHDQTASVSNELGVTLLRQGKYAEAEALLNETLAIYEGLEGPDSEASTRPLINLALLYTETQRYDQALATHERLLSHDIETKGPDFWRVGLHLNNMGLVYQDQRELAQAEDAFRRAQAVIRGAWGDDHPGLAYSVNNLAVILHDQNRNDQAEILFVQALNLRRNGLGATHPALAATLHEYGRFLIDLGRYREARPMIEQALQIRTDKLEPGDWRTQHTRALSGAILAHDGDHESAEASIIPALEALAKELGPEHWRTRDARRRAHRLYIDWGRLDAADRYAVPGA